MKDAVDAAFRLAKKGETVLLSPCGASFDLFNSYEDRGDQFKEYVRALWTGARDQIFYPVPGIKRRSHIVRKASVYERFHSLIINY